MLVGRFVDHIAVLPAGDDQRPLGRAHAAHDAGLLGRRRRRGARAAGEAHKAFVLGAKVLHADETPVPMLDPGAGKTKKAYIWGYARSEFDGLRGVVYDFCVGRGAKYPVAFLDGWNGTLVCDDYKGYEPVFKLGSRIEAGCLVHARRKFEELVKNGQPARSPRRRSVAWPGSSGSRSRRGSCPARSAGDAAGADPAALGQAA